MTKPKSHGLSRREREIMDILHRLGRAAPAQVREALPEPPTYTAVNTQLRILMDNGLVGRVQEGRQFLYFPTQPRQSAARSALQQIMQTFFGGSVEQAVTTLLADEETRLSGDQIARLTDLIEAARIDEEEGSEKP